jgi:hypothetical protein
MARSVVCIIGVFVGILITSLAAMAAVGVSVTPHEGQALFQALLTSPLTQLQLPPGFRSPTVKAKAIDPRGNPKHHHAVGEVEVDLNNGNARIVYVVFPTRADALGNFTDGVKGLKGVKGIKVQRPVAGFPEPSLIINSAENHLAVTQVSFVAANVGINAQTTRSNAKSGDREATLNLARFALRHINAVK